jgi:hypothetical protein
VLGSNRVLPSAAMSRSSARFAAAAMAMDAGTPLVSLATALGSTAATFGQQIAARRKTGNQTNQHQTDLGKSAHESLHGNRELSTALNPEPGYSKKPRAERAVSSKAYCAAA